MPLQELSGNDFIFWYLIVKSYTFCYIITIWLKLDIRKYKCMIYINRYKQEYCSSTD